MKNRLISLLVIIILSLTVLSSCNDSYNEISFFAMDTPMNIRIYGGSDNLLSSSEKIITDLEKKISVTDSESEVYNLNNNKSLSVSDETLYLINTALKYCDFTSGSMDITVYPLVEKWGFTTKNYIIPKPEEISSLLDSVDYKNIIISGNSIKLENNAEIDLGCIAKGYAADIVSDYLKKEGITSAILDLGGNIQTVGTKPGGEKWKIGIKSKEGDGIIGSVSVADSAVVTSGNYERYFEKNGKRYCHIINPDTGYPAESGLSSVTVISESGTYCDCLSTAFFVMGKDKAVEYYKKYNDFEMVLISDSNVIMITPGLESVFEKTDNNCILEIIGN